MKLLKYSQNEVHYIYNVKPKFSENSKFQRCRNRNFHTNCSSIKKNNNNEGQKYSNHSLKCMALLKHELSAINWYFNDCLEEIE